MAKLTQYVILFIILQLLCLLKAQGQMLPAIALSPQTLAKLQKPCRLSVTAVDDEAGISRLKLKTDFPSKPACSQYVQQLPGLLQALGYISSSIDSMREDSATIYIQLFLGEKYVWDDVRVDDKDWFLMNQLGFNKTTFHNKPFDDNKVIQLYNLLLNYFADNGYPFAKVGLDSVTINGPDIRAHLNIDKGFIYHIDTVNITTYLKLSKNFLYRYLGIKPHDVYQQNKLDKINQLIAELPYVEQLQPWNIRMMNTGADLNMYLAPRRSNQVNVLIGFLPANPDLGGKLLLTGDATLNLRNPFGNGETIGVNWRQDQASSPRLDMMFQRPYIFNSPFGLNFKFEMYKQDSSYININTQLGLQYILSARQSGNVYLQVQSTNVLNVDTATVIYTKQLPAVIDESVISLAFQYDFNNTDYKFNPRHGNELEVITSFGNKHIKENSTIVSLQDSGFNYAQLYDSVKLNSYQFTVRLAAAHYFQLGRQTALKAAVNAGWYQSPNYFTNELFLIGGYKLLRGFDDESIYASKFGVGTLEYHYLLGQNSYMFTFADFGWAEYQTEGIDFSHTYLGIGIGLALETKTGVVNVSFAEGKRDDTNFNFNQLKIHIGYVSVF